MNRREAIRTSAAAGLAAVGLTARADHHEEAHPAPSAGPIALPDGATVLFQGDSITDVGRSRERAGEANDWAAMGGGYAKLIAWHLLSHRPDAGLRCFNRGVSGHRVPDLQGRWQRDCIDLAPDLVSILIGVNDIWRTFDRGSTATVQDYRDQLDELLATTRDALPDTAVVVCEPFVLRCGAVTDAWFPAFDERRAAAREAAAAVGAVWVPFHEVFANAVAAGSEPAAWAGDGVHPSAQGASLMASAWLSATGLG